MRIQRILVPVAVCIPVMLSLTACDAVKGAVEDKVDDAVAQATAEAQDAVNDAIQEALATSGAEVDLGLDGSADVPASFPSSLPLPEGAPSAALSNSTSWSLTYDVTDDAPYAALVDSFAGDGSYTSSNEGGTDANKWHTFTSASYDVALSYTEAAGKALMTYSVTAKQ